MTRYLIRVVQFFLSDRSILIIQKEIIPEIDDLPAPNPNDVCHEAKDKG